MTLAAPRFTRAAILAGMAQAAPLLFAFLPFGMIVGVIAQGRGLSLAEATLMSAACYAGSAQLLALSQWGMPVPIAGVVVAAFVVNLRLALMGPVLSPWLDPVRGWRRWLSLFLMADQNWALSVTQMKARRHDLGFLFGSGVVMWAIWVLCTAVGHVFGAMVRPPPGHPLFFAALAVFLAFLVPMWRGRRDLLPWLIAGTVAWAVARALPGTSWHIVAGALAGSLAGALQGRTMQGGTMQGGALPGGTMQGGTMQGGTMQGGARPGGARRRQPR